MKFESKLLGLLLLLGSGGCSYIPQMAVNTFSAPVDKMNEYMFLCKLHRLARAALAKVEGDDGKKYCDAYEEGFVKGFVDYVDRNGGGVPPAIPPYNLQRAALHNLEKHNDMEEWFAGFRHGAQVGKASGLRERVVVPISLPPQRSVDSLAPDAYAPAGNGPAAPLPKPQQQNLTPDSPQATDDILWQSPNSLSANPAPREILWMGSSKLPIAP
jgi:hypothetical protein